MINKFNMLEKDKYLDMVEVNSSKLLSPTTLFSAISNHILDLKKKVNLQRILQSILHALLRGNFSSQKEDLCLGVQ